MYLEEVYLFTGNEQVIKKNKIDRILENVDPKEKLAEVKKMLDDGLITQEDYDALKKKLLGI